MKEIEGPDIKETLQDQIRQWFIECRWDTILSFLNLSLSVTTLTIRVCKHHFFKMVGIKTASVQRTVLNKPKKYGNHKLNHYHFCYHCYHRFIDLEYSIIYCWRSYAEMCNSLSLLINRVVLHKTLCKEVSAVICFLQYVDNCHWYWYLPTNINL